MVNYLELVKAILFSSLGYGVNLILQIISVTGYFGVFFLMVLESAFLPVPSEIVMPFAGYLVYEGKFDLWYVTLAGTIGNVVGSVASYLIGLYVGRKAVLKYGKYILLKEKYVILTENWFKKYGDKAIFFSRLLPIVRTVISLPAGVGKMHFKKFVVYTFVGSLPWCFALTYVGYALGKNWESISTYTKPFEYFVLLIILVAIVWYILKIRKKK